MSSVRQSNFETFLIERNVPEITSNELKINISENEYVKSLMNLNHTLGQTIYENQCTVGRQIRTKFCDDKTLCHIMVVAETQSGKTGSMFATILEMNNSGVPLNNIYVITGLSSKEWMDQTKNRLNIQGIHILHLPDLKKFAKDFSEKENLLILIDEVHIASNMEMTIGRNIFDECNLKNVQECFKRNVKIVEFSATPNQTLTDLNSWGDNATKIFAKPGEGYTSIEKLYEDDRLFEYLDLCCYDKSSRTYSPEGEENIRQIKEKINDCFLTPKYHIIRLPNQPHYSYVKYKFEEVFGSDYEYDEYVEKTVGNSINCMMEREPLKHTFIFIKERMRCAVTLEFKKHIGILYERYCKVPDSSSVIQGLLGRNTGYDVPEHTIVFTKISAVKQYINLLRKDFSTSCIWRCKKKSTFLKNVESLDEMNHNSNNYGFKIFEENEVSEMRTFITTNFPSWRFRVQQSQVVQALTDHTHIDIINRKWGLNHTDVTRRKYHSPVDNKWVVMWSTIVHPDVVSDIL